MSFEYWYLFPISVAIATVSMSSGIGGAVFFSPMFLLWLKLEPTVAIGTALLTELVGFSSGLVAYVRSRRIDYGLAANLLVFSVPLAVVGVMVGGYVPAVVLKAIFATGLIFLGYQIFAATRTGHGTSDEATESGPPGRRIVDRDGRVFEYTIRNKTVGRLFAAVGGMFVGMISVGLAELEEYELVVRCRVPPPVAVATSVFVVVVTVLVAVIGHGYAFAREADEGAIQQVLAVATFTVPGVLIGGQVGPRVASRVNPEHLKLAISVIFMAVGAFMLYTLTF
jgi:uncharacterized membrane protein YfcA